jgi:hypothetical protein
MHLNSRVTRKKYRAGWFDGFLEFLGNILESLCDFLSSIDFGDSGDSGGCDGGCD